MIFEKAKPSFQLRRGELRSQMTQDVVSVIHTRTEPPELSFEHLGVEKHLVSTSLRRKAWSGIEFNVG